MKKNLFRPIILFFMIILFTHSFAKVIPNEKGVYIPIDKKISGKQINELFEKGSKKNYKGNELKYIQMPCGGIGCGQIMIKGNGTLCIEPEIYNLKQEANYGHGYSTGWGYINPQDEKSTISNNFNLIISENNKSDLIIPLNDKGFNSIEFTGEYPIAYVNFKKKKSDFPISVKEKVFSPFIPLDVKNSAIPVTILEYEITNKSNKTLSVSIEGMLAETPKVENMYDVTKIHKIKKITSLTHYKRKNGTDKIENVVISDIGENNRLSQQEGDLSLSVIDKKAQFNLSKNTIKSSVSLRKNQTKKITFILSWYFPNFATNWGYKGQDAGRYYSNWAKNSEDIALYVTNNYKELTSKTNLFHDTYFDTTIPYWLSNRITMPLSTLACGNVSIWKNRRYYSFEGVSFCEGTCGHVYNFVTAISKLFPSLERSVRTMQDFNDSVSLAPSGRINFRGYKGSNLEGRGVYASDAQNGYILKVYREHLMTENNTFLDSIWPKVKRAMGYMIFRDGACIGLEPNGVLEGKQTFWDPMWYGPNPYNNTLYLGALQACSKMAEIENEPKLSARYKRLVKKGSQYMNSTMWNGEYYGQLYPTGFVGFQRPFDSFIKPQETELQAKACGEAFNNCKPAYYKSNVCDANQLFGQNFMNQFGLEDIIPKDKAKSVCKSIYKYNWTPDIATVYNFIKPHARVLAEAGEGAMINGSWPMEARQDFENTHDKYNIWSGSEYEAAVDMIYAGLVKEALVVVNAIDKRYAGYNRNPWNEIEGANHYSRAMQSWGILLALSDFTFDGPNKTIRFAPKLNPNNFKSFFSAAKSWGNISQSRNKNKQVSKIDVKYGELSLKTLSLELPKNKEIKNLSVYINKKQIKCIYKLNESNKLLINLDRIYSIKTNSSIYCSILMK